MEKEINPKYVSLRDVAKEYANRPKDEKQFSRTVSGLYRYFIPAPIHECDAFGQEVQPITEDIPCEIVEPLKLENKKP